MVADSRGRAAAGQTSAGRSATPGSTSCSRGTRSTSRATGRLPRPRAAQRGALRPPHPARVLLRQGLRVGDPALPDWQPQPRAAGRVCLELKHLDQDEFAHWTDPRGLRDQPAHPSQATRVRRRSARSSPGGGRRCDRLFRIEAPSGLHIVDHVPASGSLAPLAPSSATRTERTRLCEPRISNREGHRRLRRRLAVGGRRPATGHDGGAAGQERGPQPPWVLPPLFRAVDQVVLVDNASTDGTAAVAAEVAREVGARTASRSSAIPSRSAGVAPSISQTPATPCTA